MNSLHKTALGFALVALLPVAAGAQSEAEREVVEQTRDQVPTPPWPAGDQRGMGNTQGAATLARCAQHMTAEGARTYELSYERSNTMPMSPFGTPIEYEHHPTVGIPGSLHAWNGEHVVQGEPGAQGTQINALGHFAVLPEPWNGEGEFPADKAEYYGGYKQDEVKPEPGSPLQKLGMEQAPPIVTSAVLLDAKQHVGGGEALGPGQLVTAADIEAMIEAQGLGWRGILPGDAVYVYTGWGENWQDPANETKYYMMGPGLSHDAAKLLEEKAVVLVALDNPFTDPVTEGQLTGETPPPEGTPDGLPFVVHHENLVQAGIHNIQNAKLDELAGDRVWTSCTIVLPLRSRGASGSPVRPVAIGAPHG
jgi:kynurenine formamidase